MYPSCGIGYQINELVRLRLYEGITYVFDKPFDEILTNEENKVIGIRSGKQIIKAPLIICDPSYATFS